MHDHHVAELKEYLSIPSISTLPEHAADLKAAARWTADKLAAIGFHTTVVPTAGHPVVLGELEEAPGQPTALFYGHYDVQPVDPLGEWLSPPFEPTVRDGRIFARGASDDKGQVLLNLQAFAELREEGVPLNIVALIEGEEEIGSPHLGQVVEDHLDLLGKAGFAFVSDTVMFAEGHPSICTGLRGLASLEITVEGPAHDLHSGLYGGAVQNPLHALAAILASFHDDRGRVTVPGFYDDVVPPAPAELASVRSLPFDEEAFLAATGSPALFGEEGFSTLERLWFRPTLEVNGMVGGFTGFGGKTIVPARATAKISCRLVPDQDPEAIASAVAAKAERVAPPGVRVRVERRDMTPAVVVPTDLAVLRLAARALTDTFGREPALVRMGGSIPVVSLFQTLLGLPTLMVGFALPDDGFHGPNEHFALDNFHRGRETVKAFYRLLMRGA